MAACSKRPRAASPSRAWRGALAVLAKNQHAIHFRQHACKRKARDCRRYRLNAGETFVYCLSELCSRTNSSQVRNRLIRARRRHVLRAISACITAITAG